MKLFLKIFVVVFLLNSCNSQKTAVKTSIEKYKKQGYTVGVIEPQKTGACATVITVSESELHYDPINIEDEKFIEFGTKKSTVVFKFLPLRMMNRCQNISPIRLIEIIKIE